MKDSIHFDRDHKLHGKNVFDPENFEMPAENIIVHQDGSTTFVSYGKVTGDAHVTHSDTESMMETLNDSGWEISEDSDFIEQTHELEDVVDDGEF